MAKFFDRVKTFFAQRIGKRRTHPGKGCKDIVIFLHGVGVLFFAFNVQLPSGQLGCQPNILAALAYGNGQKFIRNNDFHRMLGFINDDSQYLSRRQRVAHIFRCICVPGNNVNFFPS